MLDADTSLREKIGVVYDGDNFPAYWTAKQLSEVMEGLYLHGLPSSTQCQKKLLSAHS